MALSQAQIQLFKDDFAEKYGDNLDTALNNLPRPMNPTAFINRVNDLVELEIATRCPTFRADLAADVQTAAIWSAKLEQAFYMINTEDYTIISGIDFTSGASIPISEIQKRVFSPTARKMLTAANLQYSGLGSGAYEIDKWRRL